MTEKMPIARLKPNQFIHLLNNNTNITTLLLGPLTYTRLDHEYFVTDKPQNFINIPPQKYCIIENPVVRDVNGAPVIDAYGQAKTLIGDREMRFTQDPFPLYPGEVLVQDVTALTVVPPTEALRLVCNRDFTDKDGKKRKAGDEWIVRGPVTYIPRIEVDVAAVIKATVLRTGQALHIRATADFIDSTGQARLSGEEWLVTKPGAYIPDVSEHVVGCIDPTVLTERVAIHVAALDDLVDLRGQHRSAGDVWLVTSKDCDAFVPTPQEKVVATVPLTIVGNRQYAIVENVFQNGRNALGRKELRQGLCSFFLHPGEVLVGGAVRDVNILTANEALLVRSTQRFIDATKTDREPGARWLVRGPCEYTPPIEVEVLEKRSSIPLDVNEGVYIRNIRTGEVRAHIGSTVLLTEDEELWNKELDPLVEELLALPRLTKSVNDAAAPRAKPRVKHMVVACNVPHNALVQVYDYKQQKCRVFLGPDLVMLMPDEEFTVVSLSGGRPKQPDMLKTLCMQLGPDFMADEIVIETLDHARLQLVLSYNWEFNPKIAVAEGKAFAVPDFVGDACKAIASRIRGFVSSETFDAFHRNSSNIIKLAVFGKDGGGLLNTRLEFPVNGLIITNVDVHSVDPVDPKTREALTKSVQLAIEITTKSQEAVAIQQATCSEQQAKGRLERQIIKDKSLAEIERRKLLELEALNAAVESTGSSKAQAKATAEALVLEGQSEVDLAEKRAQAAEVSAFAELAVETWKQEAELDHRKALYDLEVDKLRHMSLIEAQKFKKIITAIGKDTIKAIARAGPELQVKLLQGLGLQGYLVTDGTNPINLFNTAKGMTAAAGGNK